jgi:hypothetical protein
MVVLITTTGVSDLHSERATQPYPFLNPAVEPGPRGGRELQPIDPASNRIRFYEPRVGTAHRWPGVRSAPPRYASASRDIPDHSPKGPLSP